MSFARLRSSWVLEDVPTPAEFETLDNNQSKALDGFAGGAYAPSGQIILDGEGLKALDAFEVTHAAELLSASINGELSVDGAVTLTGTFIIFNSNSALNGETTVGGALRVDGQAELQELATCDGNQSWALSSGVNLSVTATGTGKINCSAPSTWSSRAGLSGDGQVVWRSVTGSPTSRTYSVEQADEVQIPATVNSGCTYTLVNNGAQAGSKILFTRTLVDGDDPNAEADLTNTVNIKANTGGSLILKSIGDASGNLRFIEFVFDGTNWFISRQEKVP